MMRSDKIAEVLVQCDEVVRTSVRNRITRRKRRITGINDVCVSKLERIVELCIESRSHRTAGQRLLIAQTVEAKLGLADGERGKRMSHRECVGGVSLDIRRVIARIGA